MKKSVKRIFCVALAACLTLLSACNTTNSPMEETYGGAENLAAGVPCMMWR